MPTFSDFIHKQIILKIPKPTESFASKTVIITGASSGLGKEAAKHIVRLGATKVILGCRSISKGEKVEAEIEASTGAKPGTLDVWQLDLESPPSIRAFVERVNKLTRLDVLINNAGISTLKFDKTYGTERTIAVNVVGTFMLAIQLIPKLKETAKSYGVTPHMTFVGSALFDQAKYPEEHGEDLFAWLGDESHVKIFDEYNLSKLLLLHGIIKLTTDVDPITKNNIEDAHPIAINSMDPCFCKTELFGDLSGGLKAFLTVFAFLFARTAEEGSRLVVSAAAAGRESHGGYLRGGKLQKYPLFLTDEKGIERSEYVWKQLGNKLEGLQPGVLASLV
ncbi:hypothetical protein MMC25_000720 [Agyrium rufum]|nr:hypothetical protein [Agyrium rufum]